LRELRGDLIPDERVREAGGGRKQIRQQQPAVLRELEQLVAPTTRGDPMFSAAVDLQEHQQTGDRTTP
jgi:hypothetical protein